MQLQCKAQNLPDPDFWLKLYETGMCANMKVSGIHHVNSDYINN
jgi:hypothetical protein